MNKLKYFIYKYIKLKKLYKKEKSIKEETKNGIIKYCIRNAYQKIIKLPFYKNPIFVYSDFENSDIKKIQIEINNYTYFTLHISYIKEKSNDLSDSDNDYSDLSDSDNDYSDDKEKDNIYNVKIILNMNDEKILKKDILSIYELKKYEYMKKCQKYLYYTIHFGFYILYLYYFINIMCGFNINIKNIYMIHFFHLCSEILILNIL